MIDLSGRTAIVTGAGGGLGRAHALLLARRGAKVVVNDLGDGADAVVEEIRAAGGQARAAKCSVVDAEAVQAMVDATLADWGRVDILVNNAGILRDKSFAKMPLADFRLVLEVHVMGAVHCTQAVWNPMRERNYGRIVMTTSCSGLYGNFGQANYAAAKLGIVALSKSIALDMQKFNVRSNCIAPFAWSRMIGAIPTDTDEQRARVDKIKQMTPAKVAPLAVYLASDAASAVNGQIFSVRNNEISLISQPRPVRSIHRSEGWTPQSIAEHAMPAMRASFYPLDRSADVFSWDPV